VRHPFLDVVGGQPQVWQALEQRRDGLDRLGLGQRRADAEMHALPEREVPLGVAPAAASAIAGRCSATASTGPAGRPGSPEVPGATAMTAGVNGASRCTLAQISSVRSRGSEGVPGRSKGMPRIE
jgi:hypothetical protein